MSREVPQAQDAERSLLGGLFLDAEALDGVIEVLGPQDFYVSAHRKVYEAILSLSVRGQAFDRVTVKGELTAQGALAAVGGEDFIDLLDKLVPSAANLAYYAKIVRDKALIRRLIEAGTLIVQLGYEQTGDVSELVDEAESKMLAACERRSNGSAPQLVRELMGPTYKQIEADYERGVAITGLSSGLEDLDMLTAGWQPGDLIIVAARPSVGKTALGLGFAMHAAKKGNAALVLSMEMGKIQLTKRLLASESGVDGQRIRTGQLTDGDFARLANVAGTISAVPLIIDDARNLSALDIRSKARRIARSRSGTSAPLALIVVDYLTMMRTDDGTESVSAKVGRNALRLKDLAGELAVPVVVLAQLNRDNAKGGKPRRPVLPDLRDSGEIEQHADVVVFIHREDGDERAEAQHELIIEKQRNGPTGNVPVSFRPDITRFDNLSRRADRFSRESA